MHASANTRFISIKVTLSAPRQAQCIPFVYERSFFMDLKYSSIDAVRCAVCSIHWYWLSLSKHVENKTPVYVHCISAQISANINCFRHAFCWRYRWCFCLVAVYDNINMNTNDCRRNQRLSGIERERERGGGESKTRKSRKKFAQRNWPRHLCPL